MKPNQNLYTLTADIITGLKSILEDFKPDYVYVHSDTTTTAANRGYLRGIEDEFNESTNTIRKELNQLTDAGYLLREQADNKVYYSANTKHSFFAPLQLLIRKHLVWRTCWRKSSQKQMLWRRWPYRGTTPKSGCRAG